MGGCVLCYTCGANFPVQAGTLRTETWSEYGSSCAAPLQPSASDNAEVCCPSTLSSSNTSVQKVAQKKTEHLDEALAQSSTPMAKAPAEKFPVGSSSVLEKPQKPQVGVAPQCVVCYRCGGGFSSLVAELMKADWLEYGDNCAGDKTGISNDNAYVCCLPQSEDLAVHV